MESEKFHEVVHLVNLTNPMMMKGPIREIIPISSQRVQIKIPEGQRVTKAKLLVAGKDIPYRMEQQRIFLTVPSISVHEVIALDFAV